MLALHHAGQVPVEKAKDTMSNKAYNIVVTPVTAAEKGTTATGKDKIKFRAKMTVGKREMERTIVAQGAAAALVDGKIAIGEEIALRILFKKAQNDDGTPGGEFATVVDLPRDKAA